MISIELNDKALRLALRSLEIGCQDMAPAMRKIAGTLQAETAINFEDEGRPAWIPSLASRKRNGPTLRDTGMLARSVTIDYSNHHAAIGSNLAYARIHQLGGSVKRKGRQVYFKQGKDGTVGQRFVKKSASNFAQQAADHDATYPARPYLPVDEGGNLSSTSQRAVIDTIVRHLQSAARG